MCIPLWCDKCGELVGVESEMASMGRLFSGNFDSQINVGCSGENHHPKPVRMETTRLFGLIKYVHLSYPETNTVSSWEEYAGSASKVKVWLAIVLGTKKYPNGSYRGVTVNGKWAWWDLKTGFYGDGWKELGNLNQ